MPDSEELERMVDRMDGNESPDPWTVRQGIEVWARSIERRLEELEQKGGS